MMEVFENKILSVKIPVDKNDVYASLSEDDTISYTLFDLEGNIVDGIEDRTITFEELDDPSIINVIIPATANVIEEGKTFSNRILVVNYTLNGSVCSNRTSYRIIPFVPYTCTEDDVRNIFGVSSEVISDSMIDLYAAYLKCKSLFDEDDTLDNALKSYDAKANLANRAISICSALTFRNSLMLLTPKIESNGVASQTRFTMSAEDFDKLLYRFIY